MSNINEAVAQFDYDAATPHDLAVLLEQVFLYTSSLSRNGGPLMVAQGIIRKFEESVRRRSAPDLHTKTGTRLREIRSSLVQLETALRGLENDASLKT